MVPSRALALIWVGVVAFSSSCVAQSIGDEIYSFGQNERGSWIPITISDLPEYLNASKISCSERNSEIDVVWNSESGDWAALDKYSSQGPFFKRTIRFAQFEQSIEIMKEHPTSQPSMTFGGEDVEQYDFLLRELTIWTQESSVPFQLPECASKIFMPG